MTNAQKVKALIESIETGDHGPIEYINPQKYIQHNLGAADGLAGFAEVLGHLPPGSARAEVIRVFEDGEFVFAHTDYNFFGPKAAFDIFRFENGLIVEHWDNMGEKVEKTASGRTQLDGPTAAADLDKTAANKALIQKLFDRVLFGHHMDELGSYFDGDKYPQHNVGVADGLSSLGKAMHDWAAAGTPMTFSKLHKVLAQGNFVLTVADGSFQGRTSAFYDLWRIENGKVAEHWDVIEAIPPKAEWKNQNGKF